MNPRPVDVTPLDDYELLVTFQNGEKKIFDAKPILSVPLYQPLKTKASLTLPKRMECVFSGIEDVDLWPDTAYSDSRPYTRWQTNGTRMVSVFLLSRW